MPFFSTSKAAENPGSISSEPAQLPPPPPPSPLQPSAPPTPGYQPRQVLNVPSGNSEISSEPGVMPAEERRSGDMKRDLVEAVKRIKPLEDLKNIGSIPCARQALLSGIVAAFGIGSISYIARRRPKSAANWAVGSFVGISTIMWENCRRARAKELAQMQWIQERYAHRHISKLRRKDGVPTSEIPESGGA